MSSQLAVKHVCLQVKVLYQRHCVDAEGGSGSPTAGGRASATARLGGSTANTLQGKEHNLPLVFRFPCYANSVVDLCGTVDVLLISW